VTRCEGTYETGFPLQIPGIITTLFINLGIAELEYGGFKVTLMRDGKVLVQVPFYGSMENVCISHPYFYWN
jgi:hypothetical protein